MRDSLNWGVIGTGGIALDFTKALETSTRGRVVSVVGSSPEKARAFSERWQLPRSAESVEQLVADPDLDAVYVASPHPMHEEHAMACLRAGKHVLCEKPMCVERVAAERVISLARERGLFLMEAFMYRCHPLLATLIERLQSGVVGRVRHLRADFGFRLDRDPEHRLFNPRLGGGAILDVGGYPVSLARLLAGLHEDKPFAEPLRVDATGCVGPHGADELASALLSFESGFSAQVTCAVFHAVGTEAVIFGDAGKIVLPDPWIPQGNRQSLTSQFTIHRYGEMPETIEVQTRVPTYALEAELVADSLPQPEPPWPAMSWADTLGNLAVLDSWRASLA